MKGHLILMTLAATLLWSGAALGQTCDGSCGEYDMNAECQCDTSCWSIGDCCTDICDFCEADFADECSCVPDCTDLECGTDGCFGSCGECAPGFGCVDGACVEGACEAEGDILDCDGICGPESWLADGECDEGQWGANFNCEALNWDEGDCVPCFPECTGKICGNDGCGGSCGDCAAGEYCSGGTVCQVNPCEEGDMPGCFGVCELVSWLGDDYCDTNFFCAEMGWDNGDCDPCTPTCDGLTCGEDPDCGMLCGVCADGSWCDEGGCTACTCDGLECGTDECGQPCGECQEDWFCNADQLCEECLCDAGWECGTADCGASCGECTDGFGCVEHMCVALSCAGACDGQGAGGCWCDAGCFGYGDCCPDICTECPDVDPVSCACVPDCDGKVCGSDGCWGTCGPACDDGEFCTEDGLCQACDCGDAVCGTDECGNPCGDNDGACLAGACLDGACYEGDGCETSDTTGCGGCACEDCVFSIDSYCSETMWDSYCVQECIGLCGGCGDGADCGDGACVFPETCSSCPADCGCPGGLVCGWSDDAGGFDCLVGSCDDDMDVGCCDDDVLHKCVDVYGFITADCAEDGNICGWFPGDEFNDAGYYCGTADQLVDEDPAGVYPAECPDFVCVADCTGLDCGPDPICGTECGPCEGALICEDGACVECQPDCTGLDCGPRPGLRRRVRPLRRRLPLRRGRLRGLPARLRRPRVRPGSGLRPRVRSLRGRTDLQRGDLRGLHRGLHRPGLRPRPGLRLRVRPLRRRLPLRRRRLRRGCPAHGQLRRELRRL